MKLANSKPTSFSVEREKITLGIFQMLMNVKLQMDIATPQRIDAIAAATRDAMTADMFACDANHDGRWPMFAAIKIN